MKVAKHPAVVAGIISAEAAFCGLQASDVRKLVASFPGTELLVRFRDRKGDARAVLSAEQFAGEWGYPEGWSKSDVRDVFLAGGAN